MQRHVYKKDAVVYRFTNNEHHNVNETGKILPGTPHCFHWRTCKPTPLFRMEILKN